MPLSLESVTCVRRAIQPLPSDHENVADGLTPREPVGMKAPRPRTFLTGATTEQTTRAWSFERPALAPEA